MDIFPISPGPQWTVAVVFYNLYHWTMYLTGNVEHSSIGIWIKHVQIKFIEFVLSHWYRYHATLAPLTDIHLTL